MQYDIVKQAEADRDGVMFCLVPHDGLSQQLLDLSKGTESLEDQHLTLAYIPDPPESDTLLHDAAFDFAQHSGWKNIVGHPQGWGVFHSEDGNVLVALWDIDGLARFRNDLIDVLAKHGIQPATNHDFIPHQTMTYSDDPITRVPDLPSEALTADHVFSDLVLSIGQEWFVYPLAGP